MAGNVNTGIFAETAYTNPNWTTDYSLKWKAYGATIIRNGLPYAWSLSHRHTTHSCSTSYPAIYNGTTGAIIGNLINDGSIKIRKNGIPLKC